MFLFVLSLIASAEFPVCSAPGDQQNPDICWDGEAFWVLWSTDRGVSWRALRDTMLPTKPPWDSVAWHIGSIPCDMTYEQHYYNHFGDWLTEWVSFIRIK